MPSIVYPFNPLAASGPNNVSNEIQSLSPNSGTVYNYVLPLYGPFFGDSLTVTITATSQSLGKLTLNTPTLLKLGVDYVLGFEFIAGTNNCARGLFGAISFIDPKLVGTVTLSYLTLGGTWVQTQAQQQVVYTAQALNPRTVSFDEAFGVTAIFPPVIKPFNEQARVSSSALISAINAMAAAITAQTPLVGPINFDTHITDTGNPHKDTAATFGLGLVPNWRAATPTEAQAGTATNLFVTPAGAAAALSAPAVVGAASTTVFGVAKLNLGGQGGDSSDATKALTTAGLLTMKNASGVNAIKSLFSYERQILSFATPIAYPVTCLGTVCNNFRDLVAAVESNLGFAPIQASAPLACIYLPYDMATPNLTLS